MYLTTLTSTKLGKGPVLTATPYVPDMDHFRGSYGAKSAMPLYRDAAATTPNVTQGLLAALSRTLRIEAIAEDLLAYVYALGATPRLRRHVQRETGRGSRTGPHPDHRRSRPLRRSRRAGPRGPVVAHMGRALRHRRPPKPPAGAC